MSLLTNPIIKPENVENDDLITVEWENGDIKHTRTARVYRRIDEGATRILYSKDGQEIFHWLPGGKNPRITLLERPTRDPFGAALFELDSDLERQLT